MMIVLFHPCSVALYLSLFCLAVSGFATIKNANFVVRTTLAPTASENTRLFAQPAEPQNNNKRRNTTAATTTKTATFPSSSSKITLDSYIECHETKPDSSWTLAWNNFNRQGASLVKQGLERIGLVEIDELRPPGCLNLRLSNEAVTQAEVSRIESGNGVEDVHPVSQVLYDGACLLLDRLYDGRPIQRFWFLETIARIPYFSYVSMLHLYESFGWFRAVELRKVHAAEDWNELHHLLIMESLGGNRQWSDRFLGYHVAFAYYWFLVVVYLGSPRIAYQFMELLEAHAVDTYTTFVNENREQLRRLPPPRIATKYYKFGDLYLFDDFQTARKPGTRRPPCDTLLDVFENIAIDEGEHVKTMKACQNYAQFGTEVVSPHMKFGGPDLFDDNDNENGNGDSNGNSSNTAEATEYKRKMWKEWSVVVNEEDERDEIEGIDMGAGLK